MKPEYVTPVSVYEVEAITREKADGKASTTYIIDVRDKYEVEDDGMVPQAIHIPVRELNEALRMSGGSFEKRYGVHKPGKRDRIVLYCNSGRVSSSAELYFTNEGYKRVSHIQGGYEEWKKMHKNELDEDL